MMRTSRIGLLLALLACAGTTPTEPGTFEPPDDIPENALRVLFVGNSLTYFNELPDLVAAMATATGRERPPAFAMVALPDYSLEDHWRDGRARAAIQNGAWDFVVMQQGPSSLPQNQEHLRTWAQTFAPSIRGAGARPALYMVWPAESRSQDFQGVFSAYSTAANAVDGIFLPAGQAWRTAWAKDASLPLYGPDGFHPSLLGSWLAGLVIYGALYDADPAEVPATVTIGNRGVSIPAEDAALLAAAAAETMAAFR